MWAGWAFQVYLLERSRVVTHAAGERGYHLFYSLCLGASPEERERYNLLPRVADYSYLSGPPVKGVGGRGEEGEGGKERSEGGEREKQTERWRRLCEQLELLGFSSDARSEIFQARLPSLHLPS